MMTFKDFQKINYVRAKVAFPSQCLTPEFLAIAIAGEAGELCNLVKKTIRGDFAIEASRGEILDELADVVTYCDLLMSVLGADTGERVEAKWDEVSKRRGWLTVSVARKGLLQSEAVDAPGFSVNGVCVAGVCTK